MNKRTLRAAIGKTDGAFLKLSNGRAEFTVMRVESARWRGPRWVVNQRMDALYPTPERALTMALAMLAIYNRG